ncbi:hypothetical protein BDZ45DRAFT_224973 [Acephala macrosclerotiorum]|nr:hypothetical protein BDZ45DRAFT_224973 [Acephala macrosclerotiorum]
MHLRSPHPDLYPAQSSSKRSSEYCVYFVPPTPSRWFSSHCQFILIFLSSLRLAVLYYGVAILPHSACSMWLSVNAMRIFIFSIPSFSPLNRL